MLHCSLGNEGGTFMTSQDDIQNLVTQAEKKIVAGNSIGAEADWIEIKKAIGHYTRLTNSTDRQRLGHLIHARLDNLGLEGEEPGPIIVDIEEKKILNDPGAWKTPKKKIHYFPY